MTAPAWPVPQFFAPLPKAQRQLTEGRGRRAYSPRGPYPKALCGLVVLYCPTYAAHCVFASHRVSDELWIQQFVARLAVEGLDIAVLPGTAGSMNSVFTPKDLSDVLRRGQSNPEVITIVLKAGPDLKGYWTEVILAKGWTSVIDRAWCRWGGKSTYRSSETYRALKGMQDSGALRAAGRGKRDYGLDVAAHRRKHGPARACVHRHHDRRVARNPPGRHQADHLYSREDRAAFPQDPAPALGKEPREHGDGRRLADAVRTEKPDDLAVGNSKRHVPDRRMASITF